MPWAVRGLRVEEYDALVEAGLLDGERVELVEGALVEVAPTSPEHSASVQEVARALRRQLPKGWDVREEKPLRVPPGSEPEPDVAVVRDQDYRGEHPSTALLVVEVARGSIELDLTAKPRVYAAAGVTEYWVVDLGSRAVHIHRGPVGAGYDEVVVQREGELTSRTDPAFGVRLDVILPSPPA